MSNETQRDRLLELGRDLAEHLQNHTDPRDSDALLQARRRALQSIAQGGDVPAKRAGWLPAAAVASIVVLSFVSVTLVWQAGSQLERSDGHVALLANNLVADDAPWREDLDMLQDMDFVLWLDMEGLEHAG